ncbi:MAG: hypothetical protein U0936_24220 [Planctomycetaceae bacterium]
MFTQRVLSISMLLLMFFGAGCGSQSQQDGTTGGAAAESSPRQNEATEETSGQMIVDLPSDVREVGSPDSIVPRPPSKKKPDSSSEAESNPSESTAQSPGNSEGESAAEAVAEMTNDEPDSPDPAITNNGSEASSSSPPPPPPIPKPAGSAPVNSDRNASVTDGSTVVTKAWSFNVKVSRREHRASRQNLSRRAVENPPAPEARKDLISAFW